MKLLGQVCDILTQVGIDHALIGAAAIAAHGVSRATQDIDLLVLATQATAAETWDALRASGVEVTIHQGSSDDPLRAVIRMRGAGDDPVDIVVGRDRWQQDVLARATTIALGDIVVPVVEPADLILLKLFAGGPQDLWDIQQLLSAASNRDALATAVDDRIAALPARCRQAWQGMIGR